MSEALINLLGTLRQMMQSANIDYAILAAERIDAAWFAEYEHQRIVNSFLFNYIKIQDKIGSKLFHLVLQHFREDDNDSMTMLDILNRLEKLRIIEHVEAWDKLREIRIAITHEYPEDIDVRIDNIRLALAGYLQLKSIVARIQEIMLAQP